MSQRESLSASASSWARSRVHRVVQADLLPHEPGVQLDVPRLVHGLGGRVELGVHVGHRLHDPRRDRQRALLAVQELAEQPRGQVMTELVPLLLGQHLPLPRPVDRAELLGLLHHVGRVDRDRPVDPLGRVPLLVLAALVQVEQPLPAVVVLPAEPGGSGRGHVPGAGLERAWCSGRRCSRRPPVNAVTLTLPAGRQRLQGRAELGLSVRRRRAIRASGARARHGRRARAGTSSARRRSGRAGSPAAGPAC